MNIPWTGLSTDPMASILSTAPQFIPQRHAKEKSVATAPSPTLNTTFPNLIFPTLPNSRCYKITGVPDHIFPRPITDASLDTPNTRIQRE